MKKLLIGVGAIIVIFVGIGAFSHSSNTVVSPSENQATQNQSTPTPQPKVEVKQEASDEVIPFSKKTVNDPSLAKGKNEITQVGVNGKITHHYDVTYTDERETARTENQPTRIDSVDQITAIGTYVAPSYPPGATAICRDGTYSYSQNRSGTCSHHGGVSQWLY